MVGTPFSKQSSTNHTSPTSRIPLKQTLFISKIQCIVPEIINTPETPNHPSVYSILASHFPLRILALRKECQWGIVVVSKQQKKH